MKRFARKSLERLAGILGLREISRTLHEISADLEVIKRTCQNIDHHLTPSPDGLPVPPPLLRAVISGNSNLDVADFIEIGRNCVNAMQAVLGKNGRALDSFESILEFGCGCGRVIRHLRDLPTRLSGTDTNPKMVEWCKYNLEFALFERNGLSPPLIYPPNSFDLAYAFSVFTHIPESAQRPWMDEIARVLRPGGLFVVTAMGLPFVENLEAEDRSRFLAGRLVEIQDYDPAGNPECGVYTPYDYMKENLTNSLEVVDWIEGRVIDRGRKIIGQDVYLLRKGG